MTSTPLHPQSNGEAERAVMMMMMIWALGRSNTNGYIAPITSNLEIHLSSAYQNAVQTIKKLWMGNGNPYDAP